MVRNTITVDLLHLLLTKREVVYLLIALDCFCFVLVQSFCLGGFKLLVFVSLVCCSLFFRYIVE